MDPIYTTPTYKKPTLAQLWEQFQYAAWYFCHKKQVLSGWYDALKTLNTENYEALEYGEPWHPDAHERKIQLQNYTWSLEHHLSDMLQRFNLDQVAGLLKMARFANAIGHGVKHLAPLEKEKIAMAVAHVAYTDTPNSDVTFSLLEQWHNQGHHDLIHRAHEALLSQLEQLEPGVQKHWLSQHLYMVECVKDVFSSPSTKYPRLHAALTELGTTGMDQKRQAYIVAAIPEIRQPIHTHKTQAPARCYVNRYKKWLILPCIKSAHEQYYDWLTAALTKATFCDQNMTASTHPQLTYRMVECYHQLDEYTREAVKNVYDMTLALYGIYDATKDQNIDYDKLSGVNVGSMSDATQLGWLIGRHLREQSLPMDLVSPRVRDTLGMYIELQIPISIASVQDIEYWCNMLEPKEPVAALELS